MVGALVDEPADARLLAVIADKEVHAPALLDFEVANALRGHALGGLLGPGRLEEALADFTALQIERHQMTGMLRYMLDLRHNFTVHDAAYVVLAQALDVPLVTTDAKLIEARRLGVDVRALTSA
jgi:predicted nucleic acid-binding protein